MTKVMIGEGEKTRVNEEGGKPWIWVVLREREREGDEGWIGFSFLSFGLGKAIDATQCYASIFINDFDSI